MAEARPARPQPRVEPGSMKLRDLLRVVSGSGLEDWTILFRPTFRHRVVETLRPDGSRDRLVVDEHAVARSEEHTSEHQSLMRISYAALCLKKKNPHPHTQHSTPT